MINAPLGIVLRHLCTKVQAEGFTTQSDGQLLERFTGTRDETAFALLLRRHGPMVLGVCRRVLPCFQDAEDVFQATFLLLARKAGSIRKQESVGSWLHGVAYRLAVTAKTQAVNRKVHEKQAATMHKNESSCDATWRELRSVLDEGLQQLPEKYRTALVLSYLEGKTHEEAAVQLGCPLATFRNWVARGRRLLRRRLASRGLALSAGALATALAANAAPAAVPATLLYPTLRSALHFAAGTKATALVAPSVAALVESGLKAMFATKLKLITVLLLMLGLLTAAGFGMHQAVASIAGTGEPVKPATPFAEAPTPPAGEGPREALADMFGDPLPEGATERLGTLRFRHGGGVVNRLMVTPDGKTLISNSFVGTRMVCVWDLTTGKLLRQFPGHWEESGAVALSPDGKELAIGQDAVIHFYELATGRESRQLQSPLGNTEGLAYSADGRMLASGHQRQTVILWDLTSTGRELGRLDAAHRLLTMLAFSPDGRTLVTGDWIDKTVRLFDVGTRRERQRLIRAVDLFDWVYSHTTFAFSPTGSTLALAVQGGAIIKLLDGTTGRPLSELRGAGKYINALAWSPDGRTLAAAYHKNKSGEGTIHVWDVATRKELRSIQVQREVVQSLVFTPDGQTVVSAGGSSVIRLWDPATGQERKLAAVSPKSPPLREETLGVKSGHRAPISCISQSPDGRLLAFTDGELRLLDRSTGQEVGTIPGRPTSFAFAPDGKTLAATGDGVSIWDVAGRRLVRQLQGNARREDGSPYDSYLHVAYSPDGKLLASGGGVSRSHRGVNATDEGMVQLWEVATGKKLRRFSMNDGTKDHGLVDGVAFLPDGKRLIASGQAISASAGVDSRVRVWDVATGKPLSRLSALMSDTSDDAPAPPAMLQVPSSYPRIVWSPDGRMLAMNRSRTSIPIWEAATGQRRLVLEGHTEATVRVAFSPDSRTLASSSWDNSIRLWDLETGKELRRLTGHRGKAEALLFSVDGKTLISAGDDTTILFWDVTAVTQRARVGAAASAAREWDALWQDLAGPDAVKAHRAITMLSAAGERVVSFLQERLQPATAVDAQRIGRLLDNLDSNSFAVREKATRELEALGEVAEMHLSKALQRPRSPESRRRAEQVLDRIAIPSGDTLRALRAVEVLEHIDTPEARQFLKALARGATEAALTREAKATLERLAKRKLSAP
jgi:RNA polymerase sigma factor (sigma-70 family)